jgi:signal transduction histidine kinase
VQPVDDRSSIPIEHARLYEAERRARIRLEHLQAVTDVALSHLELDALLRELLHRIGDILGADTCAILLLDGNAQELVARATFGIEGELGREIPVGRGFAGRVAATRQPLAIEDVHDADIFDPVLLRSDITSLLGAPLFVRGEVIGVVHIGTFQPRTFSEEDVELLQLVADRAALGIDRAQAHSEILRLDQIKLNFVAVASHELRGPAAALYGAAITLRGRGDELSADTRALLEQTIFEQADRLCRLTEQLLDLSKMDAKAIPVKPRNVGVYSVIDEVVDAVGREGINIEVPRELEAVADPLVVERVVTNLLVNALRYGKPPVVVRAEQRDRHLRIAVEDEGPGVAAELVPRLFERFERGRDGDGSGLGLAIARAYARAHGGDLIYDPAGRGARFELFLPTRSDDAPR